MPPITGYEDLVYGDGTVQSRSQVRNGIADCYEKIEGEVVSRVLLIRAL